MASVFDRPVVGEWRPFSVFELRCPCKKMDGDTALDVLDDVESLLATWRRRILTLPVERVVVDPMIQIAMINRLALLVDRYKKDDGSFIIERDVSDVPASLVKDFSEKSWYIFS